MRIISGKFKGKKLIEFKLKDRQNLRPTSDRNRESLFNILINSSKLKEVGFNLRNATILDGFCGTGAVGFEALSRGAKFITFIDIKKEHLNIARKNSKLLDVDNNTEFLCINLGKELKENINKNYDLIFLDPPYKNLILESTLENLIKANYIKKNTVIVIEYEKRNDFKITEKLKSIDKRKYGKTIFEFFILK
jgi:16S rRNA (guanine966-N2)-methyltransferase